MSSQRNTAAGTSSSAKVPSEDGVAAKIGLRLYKIGMPWPLEPQGVREFAVGLEEIFIVEERREIVENQVKQELFNWRDDVRPRIVDGQMGMDQQ